MPRQRTGSHFQRQSNIAELIGVAPDRPLTYGTCPPCLELFCLATWPPVPAVTQNPGNVPGQRPQLATPVVAGNLTRL